MRPEQSKATPGEDAAYLYGVPSWLIAALTAVPARDEAAGIGAWAAGAGRRRRRSGRRRPPLRLLLLPPLLGATAAAAVLARCWAWAAAAAAAAWSAAAWRAAAWMRS